MKIPFQCKGKDVLFAFQKNAHNVFVVPTTKNYIRDRESNNTFQIRKIKFDTGATSSLLYFKDVHQMESLITEFSPYSAFSTRSSTTPSGSAICLTVEHMHDKFELILESDIFPDSPVLQLQQLCFHLCTEDIEFILNSEQLQKALPAKVIATLTTLLPASKTKPIREFFSTLSKAGVETPAAVLEHMRALQAPVPRRKWALLGVNILKDVRFVKVSEVIFIWKKQKEVNALSWSDAYLLDLQFRTHDYLMKGTEDFQELHEISDDFFIDMEADFTHFDPEER